MFFARLSHVFFVAPKRKQMSVETLGGQIARVRAPTPIKKDTQISPIVFFFFVLFVCSRGGCTCAAAFARLLAAAAMATQSTASGRRFSTGDNRFDQVGRLNGRRRLTAKSASDALSQVGAEISDANGRSRIDSLCVGRRRRRATAAAANMASRTKKAGRGALRVLRLSLRVATMPATTVGERRLSTRRYFCVTPRVASVVHKRARANERAQRERAN